jgi:hypothetical protein
VRGSVTGAAPVVTLSPRDYDAALFDLDGVLARTATVHAAAWKKLFDDFLARRARDSGSAFVPFDIDSDCRRYVDGKPRYDGASDFLASRGITLPLDAPPDAIDTASVHALGARKDQHFLREAGADVVVNTLAQLQLAARHPDPLSAAYTRPAPHARDADGARARSARCADTSRVQGRSVRVCGRRESE